MADPIRQLLSQTSYDADGVTTVWDFSFAGGYLAQSHVKAFKRDNLTGIITDVPLSPVDFLGEFQVSITPAIVAGYELTIYRDTPKDLPLVNFADKAALTEAALDENAMQAIFVAAESSDNIAVAIDSVASVAALVALALSYASTASAAAAAAGASQTASHASELAAQASALAAAASAAAAAASAASIAGGPVASWAGLTGTINLASAKTALSITNVDNTADSAKPVSTAQATAIATAQSAAIAADPLPANVAPVALGTAAVGVSTRYARQDHVHPKNSFTSGDITITQDGIVVVPHGLGAKPSKVHAKLVCRTVQGTYAVGDEVIVPLWYGSGVSYHGCMCRPDATNLTLHFVNATSVYVIQDNTTSSTITLTLPSWKLILTAEL